MPLKVSARYSLPQSLNKLLFGKIRNSQFVLPNPIRNRVNGQFLKGLNV